MNLADNKARDVRQPDKLGGRSSIVPGRRNTDAPSLESYARMATARRGDGGAENLMRSLGIANRGLAEAQQAAELKRAEEEQEYVARGFVDQSTGKVDYAMLEKSEGYRNAVTKGRTMEAFTDGTVALNARLRALTEAQRDPDLGARRAEAVRFIEGFYNDLALDPETGELKADFQSPGATRYLAEAIAKHRPQVTSAALESIEARFNEEARGNAGRNVVGQLRTSGALDVEQFLSTMPGTVTAEQKRETFVNALPEGARAAWEERGSLDGLRTLDAILGKPAALANPVPSVTPGAPSAAVSSTVARPTAAPGLFNMPVAGGRVTSRFGQPRGSQLHNGVDIAVPVGTPVRAALGGEVLKVWTDERGGLSMRVRYDDGTTVGFAHLSDAPLAKGARVEAGTVVAKSGNSGRSTGPHLHYTMTKDGKRVNPLDASAPAGAAATAPDDPVRATPGFRLAHPVADPVTAYENSGNVPAIAGLDRLNLSAEDLGKLREERDRLAARIRAEWSQKTEEEQGHNASSMALGLYGQGAAPTSVDITRALRMGAISPQQGMTLFGILRQNTNALQSYTDRAEAKADRAEVKAREEQATAISGRYIAAILSGRMTAPAARSAVLAELPGIRDPKVQAAVANAVLATAGDVESLALNSKPVREAVRRVVDSRDHWLGRAGPRAARVSGQIDGLLDQAQAEIGTRVRDGEDPAAAEAAVLARFKPKLEAATAPGKANR
ncbi:MAG: M23 family metallopeptidase [Novosphingobium sp.]